MNPREQNLIREKIAELQARGDLFTRQLHQEKQRVGELEAELAKVNHEIQTIRESNKAKGVNVLNRHTAGGKETHKRADGLNPTYTAEANQKNLVKKLEGRLSNALVRQNEILNENSEVKAKIDKIRRKNQGDAEKRNGLESRLKEIRQKLEEAKEKTAYFTDQKDKVTDQRNHAINQNMEHQQQFAKECRELGNFISSQAELLGESIASVANDVLLSTKPVKQDEISRIGTPADDVRLWDVKLEEVEQQLSNDRQNLKQAEKKIQMYDDNFLQLKTVSGLSSTEDIVQAFVKNDDELFSYFNYIQTVNQETDLTLEQLSFLEAEIDAYSRDQVQQESSRVSVVNRYNERLKDAQEERQKISSMAREAKDTVECIAKKVRNLYDKLQCEDNQSEGDAATSHSEKRSQQESFDLTSQVAPEQNILHFMKLIEKKSMQIIAEYAQTLSVQKSNGKRRPSVFLAPKLFDKDLKSTPAAEDNPSAPVDLSADEDSDDGSGRVVSLNEMRRQAAEKLNRQSIVSTEIQEDPLLVKRMTII